MLIFDSGIGGLSTLQYIKKISPNIKYIYILDNQAFPYGNKTELFILQRSIKIIKTIKKIYPINIVVVACNTASTIALSTLKNIFNMPIIGILPDMKSAKKQTKNKIIGLVATTATINSSYIKKITHTCSSGITIKMIATNELASIAEKKIKKGVVSQKKLKNIFQDWTSLLKPPDTIILGCTHFLFLQREIKNIFIQPVYFIDTQKKIASAIQRHFYSLNNNQTIKENVLLYSKDSTDLQELLIFLQPYNFKKIKNINFS